jgi:hypothetical protein
MRRPPEGTFLPRMLRSASPGPGEWRPEGTFIPPACPEQPPWVRGGAAGRNVHSGRAPQPPGPGRRGGRKEPSFFIPPACREQPLRAGSRKEPSFRTSPEQPLRARARGAPEGTFIPGVPQAAPGKAGAGRNAHSARAPSSLRAWARGPGRSLHSRRARAASGPGPGGPEGAFIPSVPEQPSGPGQKVAAGRNLHSRSIPSRPPSLGKGP